MSGPAGTDVCAAGVPLGRYPSAPRLICMKGKNQMTNNKKLQAKDLASMKGGAAKAAAKPSGLAKASSGRVAPKAVNLSAKKR